MRSFSEFQATRRHVPDLLTFSNESGFDYCAGLEDRIEPQEGYVYDDGSLYIEDNGRTVYLLLGRDDWSIVKSRLAELELQLYAWACGEFYHDAKPADSDAAQVACTFIRVLGEWLTREEFEAMREANGKEANPDVCHSHDYCDANEAMMRALLNEGHSPFDSEGMLTDSGAALWNDAWAMAGAMLGRAA